MTANWVELQREAQALLDELNELRAQVRQTLGKPEPPPPPDMTPELVDIVRNRRRGRPPAHLDLVDRAVARYQDPDEPSARQVAAELGVPPDMVLRWLHNAGVPVRKGRRAIRPRPGPVDTSTPAERAAAVAAYKLGGLTVPQLAARYGVRTATARRWLADADVEVKRGRRRQSKPKRRKPRPPARIHRRLIGPPRPDGVQALKPWLADMGLLPLFRGGYDTVNKVRAASDDELLALRGMGPVKVARVRQAIAEWDALQLPPPSATDEERLVFELRRLGLEREDVMSAAEIIRLAGVADNDFSHFQDRLGSRAPEPVLRLAVGRRGRRPRYWLFDDVLVWLAPFLARRFERRFNAQLNELTRKAVAHRRSKFGITGHHLNGHVSQHGYHGVHRHPNPKLKRRWHAELGAISLGYQATAEEAARLYDRARIAAGMAPVNFPLDVTETMKLPAPRLTPAIPLTDVLRDIISQHGPISYDELHERLTGWDPQPTTAYTPESMTKIVDRLLRYAGQVDLTPDGLVMVKAPRGGRRRLTSDEEAAISAAARTAPIPEVARRFGVSAATVGRLKRSPAVADGG